MHACGMRHPRREPKACAEHILRSALGLLFSQARVAARGAMEYDRSCFMDHELMELHG